MTDISDLKLYFIPPFKGRYGPKSHLKRRIRRSIKATFKKGVSKDNKIDNIDKTRQPKAKYIDYFYSKYI